jgi:hypothetical protein
VTTEGILARLKGVRPSRDAWIALCPAHDDRNPSLSLRANSGKTLLHCFSGCAPEAVCTALGIGIRDLFDKPRGSREREPDIVRYVHRQIQGLRNHLTPTERERPITVVLASRDDPDPAMARALALTVEGTIAQVAFEEGQL